MRRAVIALAAIASLTLPAAADCRDEAEAWAASVWHMEPRLKVPVWTLVGAFVGRPGWFAVLAANAESPRERWMIRRYTAWCEGGFEGEAPSVPPAILELF